MKKVRMVELAAFALLAASLGGNAYLARAGLRYYEADMAVRLDPAGLKIYASDRPNVTEGPVLVLFGDSRAAMWTAPALPGGYHVVNRGIGFQTTAQILLRVDADVAPLRPVVVVLEAGVNDLKTIASFPDRKREIVSDCEANLEQIVRRCRAMGATVVITTIFDIGDVPAWRRPFWSKDVDSAVREVNAYLRSLTGDGVTMFDAGPVLDDDTGHVSHRYQLDHLHLSPAGYAALNAQLLPFLAALPRGTGQAPAPGPGPKEP